MRRIVIALASAALCCGLFGCAQSGETLSNSDSPNAPGSSSAAAEESAPCTGTFMWHKGSVPAPHSYNWTLTIHDDDTADFIAEVSHVEEPPLVEEKGFDIDPAAAEALCDSIANIAEDTQPLDTGSYIRYDLAGQAGGTTQPDDLTEPTLRAVSVVGDERMKAAVEAHEKYEAEHS